MKRNVQKQFFLAATMAIAVTASIAQALMPRGQSIYNTTIELTVANPNFYTDFGTSKAEFVDKVWAIAGGSNTGGLAYVGWIGQGNLEVGATNYQYGSVFYHFHTYDLFNGGTVTNSANYQGNYEHIYVATTAAVPTTTNGWDGFSITPYDQEFYTNYWGEGIYTANIPVGVKEFWVVISKPGRPEPPMSANSYQRYLNVVPTVIVDPNGCVSNIQSDINGDCIVNFKDFAVAAANWMECTDADNPAQCYPY